MNNKPLVKISSDIELNNSLALAVNKSVYLIIITIALLLIGLCLPIDSAVVAPGVLISSGNNKIVQHLEGGVIEDILVQNGHIVEEGDILLKVSPISARARLQSLELQLASARASYARLQAERLHEDKLVFPADLEEKAAKDVQIKNLLDMQAGLFSDQRKVVKAEYELLEKQLEQYTAQKASLEKMNII
jgi:multidrug efflux pump subunit AcrA (membrane-fusion protein)